VCVSMMFYTIAHSSSNLSTGSLDFLSECSHVP
jgi:hypothetical protein